MIGDARSDVPVTITGVGAYVPDRVVTNDDLSKLVDTSDEWIMERTGIRERRIAADEQAHRHRVLGQEDRRLPRRIASADKRDLGA